MINDIPKILNKFSTNLQDVLNIAFSATQKVGNKKLGTDYLLYGLVSQKGGIASEILKNAGLKVNELEIKLMKNSSKEKGLENANLGRLFKSKIKQESKEEFVSLTEDTKNTLLKAFACANKHKHKFIGTEHLTWGILQNKKCEAYQLLKEFSVDMKVLTNQIKAIIKNTEKFTHMTRDFNKQPMTDSLKMFCKEITDRKFQKESDKVIGREKELSRIINVLGRKEKNNPLLIGESGVGKTVIAYGLAKKIMEGRVPNFLRNKKIYELDTAKLIAGTVFRGEFEMRLKSLMDMLAKQKNIILFIDDVHSVLTPSHMQGAFDAGNILKPALTNGNIQCVCTTTFADYKKCIENYNALARRFQLVKIDEPNEEEAIRILKGLRKNYEDYHLVNISDEAIETAVSLSKRYLHNKFLPDKAIDILDETLSRLKSDNDNSELNKKVSVLYKELDQIMAMKAEHVNKEKFKKALDFKKQELSLKRKIVGALENKDKWKIIRIEDVAQTVSEMTNIPMDILAASEKDKLLSLEKILEKKVVGQREAIDLVAKFIRRSRAGISDPNRPIGSFLFLGPTGVGKTELAKIIAQEVFGSIDDLIRIDMSEFSEKFNISKLIGAPAGYIGYEEGGKLTEEVKRKPHSVVLFDEIEKAHPDVFNLFLQVLDDGILTDAAGHKIDFKNTIIIMTSNTGTKSIIKGDMGFGHSQNFAPENFDKTYGEYKEKILADVKKDYRPEFLNRIDRVVVFKPLNQASIKKIIDLQLKELQKRLNDKKIKIAVSNLVRKEISTKGFDFERGARPLRRAIEELIEDPLAEGVISERFKADCLINIDKIKEKIVLKNS